MITIAAATEADAPVIRAFIRELAEYEKLAHQFVATEEDLRRTLFGARPYAQVLIARVDGEPAGVALFFHNYSTFLARPGIYSALPPEACFTRKPRCGARSAGRAPATRRH